MAERIPVHLRPTAPLAQRVLLPGDPHRALAVAQALLEKPRMFNHTRGLWGYTGRAPDGELLTVQATGMGGPSAAIVVEELIDLGAQTLVRIGTCGALTDGFELGELVAAERVIGADGASAALGSTGAIAPDRAVTAGLRTQGPRGVTVVSTDLFYDPRSLVTSAWLADGAEVVEMEAATLLAVAAARGVSAAVLLAVTDLLAEGGRQRIAGHDLEDAGVRLGATALEALGAAG